MQDPTVTSVAETDLEVEARIYASVLKDAGLHAQVRVIEDPLMTNIARQLLPPRYQVVVPHVEAPRANLLIAEYRRTEEAVVPEEEEEPEPAPTQTPALLLVGRILIWLILLAPILTLIFLRLLPYTRKR